MNISGMEHTPQENIADPVKEDEKLTKQLPIWHVVKRECSVQNCDSNSAKCSVFAFPDCTSNEESCRDKCRIWLKACGNENLLELDLFIIHQEAFVCSIHFDNNQFKDDTRKELVAIAVPSLCLPVQIPADELDKYFAQFPQGTGPKSGYEQNGHSTTQIEEVKVKTHQCSSCTKQFVDKETLDKHWKLIHCDEGPLECTLCDKTFIRGCDYRKHCRIHTTKMRHVCVECEKCFPSKAVYDKHRKSSHSEDSPHFCAPCNRRFSSKGCLKSHQKTHSTEKHFACTLCAKRFFTNSSLKAHRATHNSKDCKCKVCGEMYPDKETLKMHFKDHEKATPYACNNCSRRFPSQKLLIIHLRTHSEISYKCKDCNKRFSTEQSLQLHLKSHLESEPAICPYCKSRFASLNRLVHHFCRSIRGKRVECPVCFQQFSSRSALDIHMPVHHVQKEPDKAYACSVCYKRFMTKSRLDSHLVTQHGECDVGSRNVVATQKEDTKANDTLIERETENAPAEEDDEEEDDSMPSEDTKLFLKLEPIEFI